MRSARRTLMTIALLATAAVAGCGEEEEASRAGAPTATAAVTQDAIPADLGGTWRVAIKRSELPKDEHQLEGIDDDEDIGYRIEFHATGGKDDGPSMTLDHLNKETFVLPISVTDEEIVIEDFVDCRSFAYAIEGDRLTFEPEHGGCAREHTVPAILTTRAWRRT